MLYFPGTYIGLSKSQYFHILSHLSSVTVIGTHPYLSDILRCDGQEVDFVSQALGGLDSGDIGVDQHSLDILFLESLDSLKTKTN